MNKPYLEVTYRKGKPFAAYLYLKRQPGDHAATTRREGDFVIDFAADGRAIGIELFRLDAIDLSAVNRLLDVVREHALTTEDFAPLLAA